MAVDVPKVTLAETAVAVELLPWIVNETLFDPAWVLPKAFASSFNCVEAKAFTPVFSNELLTKVATSLIVDPAVVVSVLLPKIPWIVNDSDWTRLALLAESVA